MPSGRRIFCWKYASRLMPLMASTRRPAQSMPCPYCQRAPGSNSSGPGTPGSGFSVTCPSQAGFSFSSEQTARCDEADEGGGLDGEEKLDQLVPRAELLADSGSIGNDGFIKFRVYYPLDAPVQGPTGKDSMTGTEMKVVEYFNCVIPAAPATCNNTVKDTGEADIDCGLLCQKPCQDGATCEFPQDCVNGYCAFDMLGVLRCGQNPNCKNMTKDDLETDVDCGGTQCTPCPVTLACLNDSDCETNNCEANKCAAAIVDAGTD